jgi:hypothetical protein
MTDFDPDAPHATEVRTTVDPLGPTTEVRRTVVKSNAAAWWAMGLVGVALIAAVTFVITQQPATPANPDAVAAAAAQQAHVQDAAQDAQTAAAQAQSAAQGAAMVSQAQAQRAASTPPAPAAAPTAPPSSDSAPAQGDQGGSSSSQPPQQ